MTRTLNIVLCLLAVASPSSALYQDQAGTFDWQRQHVGGVLAVGSPAGKSKITLITDQNIVAGLRGKDGIISWRKHLGPEERIVASLMLDKPAVAITVSGKGRVIRSWDANTGALNWEADSGAQADDISILTVATNSAQFLAAAVGNSVQLINLETGAHHWSAEVSLPAGSRPALYKTSDSILVAAIAPGAQTVSITALSIATGSITQQLEAQAPTSLSSITASTTNSLTLLSSDYTQLCLLSSTHPQISCQQISELSDALPAGIPLAISATSSGILLTSSDPSQPGAALASLSSATTSFKLLADSSSAATASPEAQLDSETKAVAFITAGAQGTQLSITTVSTSTGMVLGSSTVAAARQQAGVAVQPARAFLVASRKGVESAAVLVRWQDDLLQLVSEDRVQWAREEALAGISSSLFVDLPAGGKDVEGAALLAGRPQMDVKQQLHLQLLNFKVQFKLNTPAEAEELVQLRQQLSDKNRPTRDINGFRRMIVCATAAGKVLALHNGDGRLLWSLNYGPGAAPSELHLWRTFHDVRHAPQLVAVHLEGSAPYASVINAHTGAEMEVFELPASVEKVVPVKQTLHDGAAEQRVFLLPGNATAARQLPVGILPNSAASRQLLEQQYGSIYLWQQSASELTGYGFTKAGALLQPAMATQIWQVQLAEPVVTVAARDPWEPVHSYVKVLGDRSMKFKYLNPNTAFVATAGGGAVTVHLLDTVTGAVLHSQTHPGGRGPVRALLSEHFVVYHFYDAKQARFEVNVMEVYDATARSFSIADVMFGSKAVAQQESSSFSPADLEVLTQTFFLTSPLVTIGVTRTAKGITSKQVLLGTSSDQVYPMDKRLLDPRRPLKKKLSPEEMEEGLVPYQDTLPMFPQMYATYDKQVMGLRRVVTAATGLESTSLMFAYGVDAFHTRLAPAKNFDSLNDDFSFALLVVCLLALAVASGVVKYMAGRTQLKSKWQ